MPRLFLGGGAHGLLGEPPPPLGVTAACSLPPRPPPHVSPCTRGFCLTFVFLHRLNGAVTEGYEQDVGTRTSFYGFTAFSLTQSLVILGHRGFRHAPLGKVSRGEGLDEGAPRREREPGTLGLESAVGTRSVPTRGKSGEAGRTPAAGQSGVAAGPPQSPTARRPRSSGRPLPALPGRRPGLRVAGGAAPEPDPGEKEPFLVQVATARLHTRAEPPAGGCAGLDRWGQPQPSHAHEADAGRGKSAEPEWPSLPAGTGPSRLWGTTCGWTGTCCCTRTSSAT